jgi:hypothetical protein
MTATVTTGARLDVVTGPPDSGAAAGRRGGGARALFVVAGVVALAAGLAASWMMRARLERFQSALDSEALARAGRVFAQVLDQQRARVAAQVAVLAGDTRVRAPVMTPTFDEGTVRDVLEDLKVASASSMVAILDVGGKVRAVAGAPGLRNLDLGSSPLVKAALEQPGADLWTLPDRALVVGVAPVRAAGQTVALLAMGFEVGPAFFGALQRSLGVDGALLVADRVAASSTSEEAKLEAFRATLALPPSDEDQPEALVTGGGQTFLTRVGRAARSTAAGKVAWLVPRHHQAAQAGPLPLMIWFPAVSVALTFALLFACSARSQTGQTRSKR